MNRSPARRSLSAIRQTPTHTTRVSIPTLSPQVPAARSWGLIAAAAFCWFWGGLMGALYVPTFLEEVRAGKPRSYLVSHGAVALAMVAIYLWSGYAFGRRRKAGAITAISVSTLVAVLVMTPPD